MSDLWSVAAADEGGRKVTTWPYPSRGTVAFSILVPIALAAGMYVPEAYSEAPEWMVGAIGKVVLCTAAPLGNFYLIRSVFRSMKGSKVHSVVHGVAVGAAFVTALPFVIALPRIILLMLFGVGLLGLLPIASAISSYRIGQFFSPRLRGRYFLFGIGMVLMMLYASSSRQMMDYIAVSRMARAGFRGADREELRDVNPKLLKSTVCGELPRLEELAYWPLNLAFPITDKDLAASYLAITGNRLECGARL